VQLAANGNLYVYATDNTVLWYSNTDTARRTGPFSLRLMVRPAYVPPWQ
jgi:hypothetical protein